MRQWLIHLMVILSLVTCARGQITVPGADGSDGAFSPTGNIQIDLSQAATGQWDQPSPVAGKGVYDPNKWAVVFKYSSVNIPSGVTVTFKNHGSRAPVVWLVSGDVTVSGALRLDGQSGTGELLSEPGPGGFRGGRSYRYEQSSSSAGFGIGGGGLSGSGSGSHRTKGNEYYGPSGPAYGNALALMGGSGGRGVHDRDGWALGGGAGGGAILIASTGTISVNGLISAQGGQRETNYNGSSPGSGGTIRLVADCIQGNGALTVLGAWSNYEMSGGHGYIRLEGNRIALAQPTDVSLGLPGTVVQLWPPETTPTVRATLLGGQSVPVDPRSLFDFPLADVSLSSPSATMIRLECANVPLTWRVYVRVVPKAGQDFTVDATFISGDANASIWQAPLTLPNGFSAIQARACKP